MGVKLESIEGTDYTVIVGRDSTGGYDVEVFKPSTDPGFELELVAARYLEGTASVSELNSMVREVIDNDHPSLVGVYIGSTEEETEESSGNRDE